MTVNAHFDGRAIIPDEPLDLRPNQALIVQIELIEGETEESGLAWIAANAVDSDALPAVGGGEKGYQFSGREGATCGVTLWPPVGAEMGKLTASSLRWGFLRF
jgi:hypothetical protein